MCIDTIVWGNIGTASNWPFDWQPGLKLSEPWFPPFAPPPHRLWGLIVVSIFLFLSLSVELVMKTFWVTLTARSRTTLPPAFSPLCDHFFYPHFPNIPPPPLTQPPPIPNIPCTTKLEQCACVHTAGWCWFMLHSDGSDYSVVVHSARWRFPHKWHPHIWMI